MSSKSRPGSATMKSRPRWGSAKRPMGETMGINATLHVERMFRAGSDFLCPSAYNRYVLMITCIYRVLTTPWDPHSPHSPRRSAIANPPLVQSSLRNLNPAGVKLPHVQIFYVHKGVHAQGFAIQAQIVVGTSSAWCEFAQQVELWELWCSCTPTNVVNVCQKYISTISIN